MKQISIVVVIFAPIVVIVIIEIRCLLILLSYTE